MRRIKQYLNDLLWRLYLPKKPAIKPEPTTIEFGEKDEEGFKEVRRNGKPIAKLYIWDKATVEELRAIAGIGKK